MMDPFSITEGCTGLLSSIQSLSLALGPFVIRVRNARKDIEAVQREVSSLHICILSLKEEPPDSRYPASLRKSLSDVIKQCNDIVIEMTACLPGQTGAEWVLTGQSKVSALRSRLEAHKATIDIALDMMALPALSQIDDTATAIQTPSIGIKQDAEMIYQHTTQLLAEIKALKTHIAEMETAQLADDQVYNDIRVFTLQRFLDQSSTYTESIADTRNSMSGLDAISERQVVENDCDTEVSGDLDREQTGTVTSHDALKYGEASEYDTATLQRKQKEMRENGELATDSEATAKEEGIEITAGRDLEEKVSCKARTSNVTAERIEHRIEASEGREKEEALGSEGVHRPEDTNDEARKEADELDEQLHEGADGSQQGLCRETEEPTLNNSDVLESSESQHEELPKELLKADGTDKQENYQLLTLTWTPVADGDQGDLSTTFQALLSKLQDEHSQKSLVTSDSARLLEERSSSTVEELQEDREDDLRLRQLNQNIETLQNEIDSMMQYRTPGYEEQIKIHELELWNLRREWEQCDMLNKESHRKGQRNHENDSDVDGENEEKNMNSYESRDELEAKTEKYLKTDQHQQWDEQERPSATLNSPDWDAFHVYNLPSSTNGVQKLLALNHSHFSCRSMNHIARGSDLSGDDNMDAFQSMDTDSNATLMKNWSLDTEKEVADAYFHKKLPTKPRLRVRRKKLGKTVSAESTENWLSLQYENYYDTGKELAIYIEKELVSDLREDQELEQLESHKADLDATISRMTSGMHIWPGEAANSTNDTAATAHMNRTLERLRKLRDLVTTRITALRDEYLPLQERPRSRLIARDAQAFGNDTSDLVDFLRNVEPRSRRRSIQPNVRERSQTVQHPIQEAQSSKPRTLVKRHQRNISTLSYFDTNRSHNTGEKLVARDARPVNTDMTDLIEFLRDPTPKPAARSAQATGGFNQDLVDFFRNDETNLVPRGPQVTNGRVLHLANCIRYTEPRSVTEGT